MLLALDVGNTNITIGVFKRKEIIEVFRITTKLPRTSDEFGILISSLLKEKGLDEGEVKAAIIGSVVPNIMHSLSSGLIKYFDVKPIIVGPGIKTGINLGRFNPREVGADRIVDLVAGYELYGGPVIVVDFGTATTPLCTFHLSKTCPTDLLYFAAIPFNISSSNGLYLPPPSGAHASGITS